MTAAEIAALPNDRLKLLALAGEPDVRPLAVKELYWRLEAALKQIKP